MSIAGSIDHDMYYMHLSDTDGMDEGGARQQNNKVIITLSGKQSVEALPAVMGLACADEDAELIDIGQFVVRDRFLSTALIMTPHPEQTVKEILYRAQNERNRDPSFQVEFSYPPFASHPSASSLSSLPPSTEELILIVFAPSTIPSQALAELTGVVLEHQGRIVNIMRLTDTSDPFMSLQFRIILPTTHTSLKDAKRAFFEVVRAHPSCDIAIQRANVMRNAKRIVVFDLSWTLVECDAVDIVLAAAGITPPEDLHEKYNNGLLERSDWLFGRVKLLAGVDARCAYNKAVQLLTYTPGALQLCKGLKRLGCRLAVMSSGCKVISDAAKEVLGLDYAFGNEFEVDSTGKFTGNVLDPIVDADRKAELVQMLAMQERIDTEQIVAVGDGPVSSKMLASAGMSIAFDQPGATNDVHSGFISSRSLASVLYLLGVTGQDYRVVTRG